MSDKLEDIAKAMVQPGQGILAADESTGTIKKRFDSIKVASTEDNRRDYREMLFRADDAMKNHISGVILYDETLRQKAKDGTSLADVLLPENSTYAWQVAALDPAGNLGPLSDVSAPVRIGPRINVAPSGTVSSSTPVDGHGPELAIDGNTDGDLDGGSLFRGDLDADPVDRPWWGIDLGSVVHVDELVMYPRTDASWAETNNRLRAYHNTSPISGASLPAMTGNRVYTGEKYNPDGPRIENFPIAEGMRYLRFFNNSARLSLAEVQVLTTLPVAAPVAPAADTTDPTEPPWKAVRTRDGIAVLHWGPASDDRGVAFYEIWSGATRFATTTKRSWHVGDAPQLSRDFTVVAVDAAGNRSLDLQTPIEIGVCGFTRASCTPICPVSNRSTSASSPLRYAFVSGVLNPLISSMRPVFAPCLIRVGTVV